MAWDLEPCSYLRFQVPSQSSIASPLQACVRNERERTVVGPLSGKTTVGIIAWLVMWFVFAKLRQKETVNMTNVNIAAERPSKSERQAAPIALVWCAVGFRRG